MTETLHRPTEVGSSGARASFWPVVVATAGVAVIAAAWTTPTWMSVGVVVAVIAVFGIPHGAVDHLVAEAIDDRTSRRRFVTKYVLAMVGFGLAWLIAPPLMLAIFLLLSVHHFGQSDLAHLRVDGPARVAIQWSRGVLVVGLPLVAHVDEVDSVVARLAGVDPADWPWLADHRWWWCGAFVVQHLLVGLLVARHVRDRAIVGREAITVAVLTPLFLTADPLVGFAVYFGLWHSLAHLRVLADLLGTGPHPMRSLARLVAPLTAVSLAALAAVAFGATAVGRAEMIVPLLFVFVAMLTLPHMVVVERMWRPPRPNVSRGPGPGETFVGDCR